MHCRWKNQSKELSIETIDVYFHGKSSDVPKYYPLYTPVNHQSQLVVIVVIDVDSKNTMVQYEIL